MLIELFDRRLTQTSIGIVAGIPLTIVALFGLIYGLSISIGSAGSGEVWITAWGPVSILGVLGTMGAWRRLLKTNRELSMVERRIIRRLLWCGISASAYMAVQTGLFPDTRLLLAPFFAASALAGVLFLYVTPHAL